MNGSWTWVDDAWHYLQVARTANASTASYVVYMDGVQLPPDDDDGGAGVREPRRPRPHAPAGAEALPIPT